MTAIRALAPDELDLVEPLWRALHAHHVPMGEVIAPVRPENESWRRRRRQYEAWVGAGDAVLLLAEDGQRAVGYAAVRVEGGPSTWDVGERVAELETLSVAPDARGSGIGRDLVAAAREAAATRGATALFVGVAAANEGALRFYEREQFRRFYTYLWQPLG